MNLKSFFVITCISMVLTGCVNNLAVSTTTVVKSDNPIIFEEPIVAPSTKSPSIVSFPYDDFGVVATHGSTPLEKVTDGTTYLNFIEVFKETRTIDDVEYSTWTAPGCYWPKQGTLTFSAWYPYDLWFDVGANGVFCHELSFDHGNVDALYSDRIENATYNDMAKYTSPNNIYGVQVNFHHALSKIEFTAKIKEGMNFAPGTVIKITDVDIVHLKSKGSFRQNLATNFSDPDGEPAWIFPVTPTYHDYLRFVDSPTYLTEEAQPLHLSLVDPEDENIYVIPQTFNDEAGIVVDYTVIMSGIEMNYTSEKVLLKDLVYSDGVSAFQIGRKYTFEITIGDDFEPILFAPTVSDWTPVNGIIHGVL